MWCAILVQGISQLSGVKYCSLFGYTSVDDTSMARNSVSTNIGYQGSQLLVLCVYPKWTPRITLWVKKDFIRALLRSMTTFGGEEPEGLMFGPTLFNAVDVLLASSTTVYVFCAFVHPMPHLSQGQRYHVLADSTNSIGTPQGMLSTLHCQRSS